MSGRWQPGASESFKGMTDNSKSVDKYARDQGENQKQIESYRYRGQAAVKTSTGGTSSSPDTKRSLRQRLSDSSPPALSRLRGARADGDT